MPELNPDLIAQLQLFATQYLLQTLSALLLFVIGLWLARYAQRAIGALLERLKVDPTLIGFSQTLIYWGMVAVVSVTALNQMGVGTASLTAVVAATSLAIGFALQGSLSNFAAGVVILLLRPYRVGDYVEIAGQGGWVRGVQIFNTYMETRDHKTIIIPNSNVTSDVITNYSTKGYVRLDMVAGIGYGDDIRLAKRVLMEIMTAHPKVLKHPAPQVGVLALGESSVDLAVRPFVLVEDYWRVQLDINEQIKLRFDAEGISIPFPQTDVHLYRPSVN